MFGNTVLLLQSRLGGGEHDTIKERVRNRVHPVLLHYRGGVCLQVSASNQLWWKFVVRLLSMICFVLDLPSRPSGVAVVVMKPALQGCDPGRCSYLRS
jgi:endonuclease/exonuclease/phosphatase (EEP) superfamily protein YafD